MSKMIFGLLALGNKCMGSKLKCARFCGSTIFQNPSYKMRYKRASILKEEKYTSSELRSEIYLIGNAIT